MLSLFGVAYAAALAISVFVKFEAKAAAPEARRHIESLYCGIYYDQKSLPGLVELAETADADWALAAGAFGFSPELYRPVIYVCEDSRELAEKVGAAGAHIAGAYVSGVIYVTNPGFWEVEPLFHEMAHFALDKQTNGNHPRWFTEGVALYFEKTVKGFEWKEELGETDVSSEDLTSRFAHLETGKAYRKAYVEIARYAGEYGENSLLSLIGCLGKGADFERLWR
jgi:hypothetical protein